MNTNTTYMHVLGNIAASGSAGIRYATLSRAAKRHVMSLQADKVVAGFVGDEAVGLDNPEAVVCLTTEGLSYVALLQEGGLLAENLFEQPAERLPKANKKRRGKVAAKVRQHRAASTEAPAVPVKPESKPKTEPKAPKVVPTATESLHTSPVHPKPGRMVPGNAKGDQFVAAPSEPSLADVLALLEKQEKTISALKAVVLS